MSFFKKVACFTDIHFGLKGNSRIHNDDCEAFIYWFIKQAKAHNCETCIFLGDWHHHRSATNVSTMNYTVSNIERLGKAFEKYYAEIEKNQQVLLALADIMIETYFSESTLKRTIKNINRSNVNDQYYQIEMAKLYIYEASQITLKKSKDIIISIYDTQLQEELLAKIKELVSYEENPNIFNIKKSIADKIISENKYCF